MRRLRMSAGSVLSSAGASEETVDESLGPASFGTRLLRTPVAANDTNYLRVRDV